jgi:hypothetical protein
MRATVDRRLHDAACMKTTAILLGACLFACTSGEPDKNSGEPDKNAFPDQCSPTACEIGPTITSANELVAIIEATSDWVVYGPYTTGCLRASADMHVSGTVTVNTDSIAVPTFCQNLGDCRKAVRFRSSLQLQEVECLQPEPWFDYTLCAGITLRDTTVRLRMLQEDIHPSSFGNFAPIVDVLPACATPCGSSELACEATHTCWSNVRDHCAYCLGGSNEACACWNGARFDDDGTQCSFALSGDLIANGTCHAGTCETK